MDNEVAEARARLAARFGKGSQMGGKGTLDSHIYYIFCSFAFGQVLNILLLIGTQRRVQKKTPHNA